MNFEISVGNKTYSADPWLMFKILFENSPTPTCFVDQNGVLLKVNKAMYKAFGFSKSNAHNFIKQSSVDFSNKFKDDNGIDTIPFDFLTLKERQVGGKLIISNPIFENISIGFLSIEWIEGLKEFSEALDIANSYLTRIAEECANELR